MDSPVFYERFFMALLIVTDLDGTLLADDKSIDPEFWALEAKFAEKDIYFSIASGRPYPNMTTVFEQIKDRVYFISDNGSFMAYQDQELLIDPLQDASVVEFVELSRLISDSYPVLCGKKLAYMEDNNPRVLKQTLKYYQHYKIVDDLTRLEEKILKVSLCDLISSENNSYPHYKKYEQDFNVAVSSEVWLDLNSSTANKGTAVKKLQNSLGIGYDNTIVFGDFLNDLELMQVGKYSFAMKNGHPKIKETARYVTEFSNNESGVIRTIEKLLTQIGVQ